MWAALKATTWQLKLGITIGFLAILAALIGSTAYVSYHKGLNVSKVAISQYETKVQKLNAQIAQAQGKVDVRVVTQYKDRVNYVDRVVYRTQTVVAQSVPEQFHFSKGWIYTYNQSVLGLDVDPVLASDASPASTTDLVALRDTIIPNNGVTLRNKAKLDAVQQWERESDDARKAITTK